MADPAAGSVWAAAVAKQRARRERGTQAGKLGMTDGVFLEDLKALGTILCTGMPKKQGSRANYQTVVVGYWSYDGNGSDPPLLFLVTKLSDVSQSAQAQVLLEASKKKLIFSPEQLIVIDEVATNLHAEMAIVQYICGKMGVAKQNLRTLLEIYCVGKGVCLDCSGWLTKHGVVHAPLSGAPSPTGWKNPLTGALYKASEDKLEYTKGMLTMSHFNREYGGPYSK